MKLGTVITVLVVAAMAAGGALWISQYGSTEAETAQAASEETQPTVPEGPHPKAVVDETTHDFGAMQYGTTGTHTFVIRNEGEAPLEVEKGDTSCSCTLSELEEGAIPPGGEVEVKLEWTPKDKENQFRQRATIKTNDPFRKEVVLTVEGRVEDVLTLLPNNGWDLGRVSGDDPLEVSGVVYSPVRDEFELLGVEHDETITHEVEPLTEEELAEYEAKSGYRVNLVMDPTGIVGAVSKPVTIETDVEGAESNGLNLRVSVAGPLQILRRGDGFDFHPSANVVNMRTFPAAKGKQVRLAMVVDDPSPDEKFEVTDVTVEPDVLNVTTQRDETFRVPGKTLEELIVEFPAGGSPEARKQGDSTVKILVKTNHPRAKEVKFHVQYVAR